MPVRKDGQGRQAVRDSLREEEQFAVEQDQAAGQERERAQAARAERAARVAATTVLRGLGVAVRDGQVFRAEVGVMTGRDQGRPLGDLAGAHAEVTGGRAGRRRSGHARTVDTVAATALLGPAGLLAALSRRGTRGTAFVVFADGTVHEQQVSDEPALRRAQADAVRFNALAAASQRPAATRLADELTRLAGLHAAGALSDAEFQAAKARLLGT
jgi:hypothetical protein